MITNDEDIVISAKTSCMFAFENKGSSQITKSSAFTHIIPMEIKQA